MEAFNKWSVSAIVPTGLYELYWSVISPIGLRMPDKTNLDNLYKISMYWLACAIAAQVLTVGFISYTVSFCDKSEHPYLSHNFKSFLLSGFGFALGDKVLLTRLKLACIGDMLGGPVWAFGAESFSNDKTRHELITTAEDFVDTFGRSYFIPLEGSEDLEISSIVAGGGAVVASEAESRTSVDRA